VCRSGKGSGQISHECYIAYGQEGDPLCGQLQDRLFAGNKFACCRDSRILGTQGYFSKLSTLRLVQLHKKIKPE